MRAAGTLEVWASGVRALATATRSIAFVVLGAQLAHASDAALWPGEPLQARSSESAAWTPLWSAPRAPEHWAAALPVADSLRWRELRAGLSYAELDLRAGDAPWTMRVQLVRLDPRLVRLHLVTRTRDGGLRGAWMLDDAPRSAAFACNAGQFTGGAPWGWLVRSGRREHPAGFGPLSAGVRVDSSGAVTFVAAESLTTPAAMRGTAEAFQSYPLLLAAGCVPAAWGAPDPRVDGRHRDSRLALGMLRDGQLLFALTRVATPGGTFDVLPLGPTAPEMVALMGALGCRDAVLLDGGISGQMLARDAHGRTLRWPGLRHVPLALIAESR